MLRYLLLFWLFVLFAGCASVTDKAQRMLANPSADNEDSLISLVQEEEYDWVCQDAALALGKLKSQKSAPILVAILNNKARTPYCRMSAGIALGMIGDITAVEPLLNAMQNASNPEERYWLVVALGFFKDGKVYAMLESLENDSDILVARAARKALLSREGGAR